MSELAVEVESQQTFQLSPESEDVKVSLVVLNGHKVADGRIVTGHMEIEVADSEPGRHVFVLSASAGQADCATDVASTLLH